MKKVRCLITDDEPLARSLVKSYVQKIPTLNLLGECGSATETAEFLKNNEVDLIFLDIQMPDLSGMSLAKTIPSSTKVIFTTAFDQYAIEGYKVNAIGYLLKPISFDEFSETVSKAMVHFKEEVPEVQLRDEFIMIKADYKIYQIKLSEIKYIEGVKDYVKIHQEGEGKPLMPLMSMKFLEETLPSDRFMRVHRSYIVNLDQIKVIERNQILFDKVRINVSDNYKEQFNAFLEKRFG
ncbi:response regulator transcription factor [bacterium]|nr:response regulator transcription factor [bacterium]